MVGAIVILLSTPLFGAWADARGRHLPFMVNMSGMVAYTVLQTAGVFFMDRVNIFYFFLLSELLCGCVGGIPGALSMGFAIVSDDARADKSLVGVFCFLLYV